MNININNKKIDFERINVGDVVITQSGEVWLIMSNDDKEYTGVNLIYNRVEDIYLDTFTQVCEYIENITESKIVNHVPSSKVTLFMAGL